MKKKYPTPPLSKKKVSILVGICSCLSARERRDTLRETWLRHPQPGIECLFFLGSDQPLPGEENDTVSLPARDDYDHLPEKVMAFFQYALEHYDFEWLFKCDDDTYLMLERLMSPLEPGLELIGDESLARRGAPSGGAGYYLSRSLVEKIVQIPDVPATGAEDLIYGEIAQTLKAKSKSTPLLQMASAPCPLPDNEIVSAHWCPPAIIRAIESLRTAEPIASYDVTHKHWQDKILFYDNGLFRRLSSGCMGRYEHTPNALTLRWFSWAEETTVPVEDYYIGSSMVMQTSAGSAPLKKTSGIQEENNSLLLVQYGCGTNFLQGWINLDLPHFNICKPLQWEDESVDAFFLEHVIEHVSAPDAYFFFTEAFRTLRKGGVLRLAYPDIIRISREATPEYLQFLQSKGWGDGTPASAIRNIVINHGHRTAWSSETLTLVLESVGFTVIPVSPGNSEYPWLRNLESHDSQLGHTFNLIETECLECIKN